MKNINNTLADIQLNQAIEQLKEMNDSELQICHNDYCISVGYEDTIVSNVEWSINKVFTDAWDVLSNIEHYNSRDDYFYLRNGKIVTFNYLTSEQSPITFSELAQWLINEDKLSEYDISVTTLEDMLASIEDNITDDENLLYKLCDYLNIKYNLSNDVENLTSDCMDIVDNYDYDKLNDIINHLGIDYQP